MDSESLQILGFITSTFVLLPFLIFCVILPIIILVKFFNIAADVKQIKLHLKKCEETNITSNIQLIAAIRDIAADIKSSSPNDNQTPKVGVWSEGITPEVRAEAERIIAQHGEVDGVIIENLADGSLDVWSEYRWGRFGAYDSRYRLVYKGF